MSIRLLAIDLDGTLLSTEKRISPENVAAINRARAAGIEVVLASGRIRTSMLPFARLLHLDGPMICGNGTQAYLSDQEILFTLWLPEAPLHLITDYANSLGLHANLYTPDTLYFLRDTKWGDLYRSRVETIVPKTLEPGAPFPQCLKAMIVDSPARILEHIEHLHPAVGKMGVRITESEPEYLEFMVEGATKGTAIQKLATRLGLDQLEVAAIGDYLNDVEMLQWAGTSAAVANAHEATKNSANYVVSSNDEEGVAEFIDEIVLKL
jgi:Cof subfamily protein (haloacid dehalogenase superfamily)